MIETSVMKELKILGVIFKFTPYPEPDKPEEANISCLFFVKVIS